VSGPVRTCAGCGRKAPQAELLRFVYGHAKEELGHEQLVLNDLKSIGL